jgi:predicted transcriptional regulator
MNDNKPDLTPLVAQVVAAYVSNHKVETAELPLLIQHVYQSFLKLDVNASSGSTSFSGGERPEPAVSIKKSVTPDYIICLEDGKKLKMLKRHLMTAYNMTPEQYRERWGLPADYPMVAPNYAKQRSKLARAAGLGTKGRSK